MKWTDLSDQQRQDLLKHLSADDVKKFIDVDDFATFLNPTKGLSDRTNQNEDSKAFEQFLASEYNNIANAHFNTDSNITKFFQFYLLVIGLPITVFGVLFRLLPSANTQTHGAASQNVSDFLASGVGFFLLVFLLAVALVGFCMMAYVANLRFDSIQYARVVNGIRRYFYERGNISLLKGIGLRVLPYSVHRPRLLQLHFFGWVIGAFAVLNSLYVLFAMWVLFSTYKITPEPLWLGLPTFLWLAIHFIAYFFIANYRENRHLRKHIVGIDVDGVLNKHRSHFCNILRQESGENVDPDSITKIPVRECTELVSPGPNPTPVNLTGNHEMLVFNQVEYWSDMPPVEDAKQAIRKLKETHHFKIWIFTYRPWPNPASYESAVNNDQDKVATAKQNWNKGATRFFKRSIACTVLFLTIFVATIVLGHFGVFDGRSIVGLDLSVISEIAKYASLVIAAIFATMLFGMKQLIFAKPIEWPFGNWALLLYNRFLVWLRSGKIYSITKQWLRKNKILFDRLVVEGGDAHVAYPRTKYRNRFQESRLKEVRIFIEDTPEKAIKLAQICDYVFLIKHPYNSSLSESPRNLIEVESLSEAVRHIRDFL